MRGREGGGETDRARAGQRKLRTEREEDGQQGRGTEMEEDRKR